MSKKQKKNLIRILIVMVMVIALIFLPVTGWIRFGLYMIAYLVVGYDVLIKAGKGIINRQPFDESLLMAVATIGAIGLALYEKSDDYNEAIAVMLFYQIGEWFQGYAVGRSRKNIADLMDICPDYANIEGENGELTEVDPDDVEIGTVIVVKAGEKIPIDGIVVEGTSFLDTAALTGESLPRELISTRYRKPGENEKPVYLTASDIVARFGGQVRLSAVQVGKALQDMGFQQYRTKHGRFWKLFERPASDIGNIVPDGVVPTEKDLPF